MKGIVGGKSLENMYSPKINYSTILKGFSQEIMHRGYTSLYAKPCKCCGSYVVFERDREDVDKFIAICSKCELRAEGNGTLEEMMERWNSEQYSEDSYMVHKRLRNPDVLATKRLANQVIGTAVEEIIILIKRKHEFMKQLKSPMISDVQEEVINTNIKKINEKLSESERFLKSTPLMFDLEADALISGIRSRIYPNLTTEERLKIPLHLTKL